MTDVLGTPVQTGAAVSTALLLSDLHVPEHGGPVVAALVGALRAAERLHATVFVLGDLFDSYVTRAQVRTGVWRDVAAALRSASERGVPAFVLVGNRDFLLGPEFEHASGARVVPGGYRAPLGGVDTLLLHGDELCQNDLPYQRAKRWLRMPAVRWICRRLPLWLALRLAARARRRSRQVITRGDQERFLPSEQAVLAAFATGPERLVFGHVHRHAHGHLGDGEYRILPAFDATATGIAVEPAGWRAVRFMPAGEVAPVADPGPSPWSR